MAMCVYINAKSEIATSTWEEMECLAAQSQFTNGTLSEKDEGKHQYWMTEVGGMGVSICERDGNEILKLNWAFALVLWFLKLLQKIDFCELLFTK